MDYDKLFFYVILTSMLIVLFPITQAYIIGFDSSGWTFTGHEIVWQIVQVIPYLLIISAILVPIYFILGEQL
jgi:hypothetical protein